MPDKTKPDLIDRAAAIKNVIWAKENNMDEVEALEHTMSVPDAAPMVHGRWIENKSIVWCNKCSLCGSQARIMHNYCPNCGARMDGGEEKRCLTE